MRKNAQKCAKKCAKKCAFSWGVNLSGQKVRDRWTCFQQKGDIWNQHKIANLLIPNFSYFGDKKILVNFFTMKKKICIPIFFSTPTQKRPRKNAQVFPKTKKKCAKKCAKMRKNVLF